MDVGRCLHYTVQRDSMSLIEVSREGQNKGKIDGNIIIVYLGE
jgi:hypothetical protein